MAIDLKAWPSFDYDLSCTGVARRLSKSFVKLILVMRLSGKCDWFCLGSSAWRSSISFRIAITDSSSFFGNLKSPKPNCFSSLSMTVASAADKYCEDDPWSYYFCLSDVALWLLCILRAARSVSLLSFLSLIVDISPPSSLSKLAASLLIVL